VVAILEARDARVLFMDAIRCATSSQAEQAALEKAMGLAAKIGWTQCEFRTDSRDVHWPKGVDRPEGWALQRIDRSQNVAAHVVAKEGLKLWQAGRRGVPTEELAASASSVIT
jgi:ribonuclease HI